MTKYWETNWDTGTPDASWPCKGYSADCTVRTFDGFYNGAWYCGDGHNWGHLSTRSSEQANSGLYSFKQIQETNESEGCPILRSWGFDHLDKFYIRFYFYAPSAVWSGNPGFMYDSSRVSTMMHFINLNSAQGANALYLDICGYGNGYCDRESRYAYYCSDYCDSQVETDKAFICIKNDNYDEGLEYTEDCFDFFDHLDEWICIEYMMDVTAENQKIAKWINGIQTVGTGGNGVSVNFGDFPGIGTDHGSGVMMVMAFRSGGVPIQDGAVCTYYIDDIAVGDSYIGLTGGSGTTGRDARPKRPISNILSQRRLHPKL